MLKMKSGFFGDDRIKSIRRYPKGDRYVMIFTMLVGLAEKDYPRCALVSNSSVPMTKGEILGICNVKESVFDEAMLLFEANGMTETIDGVIYINISGLFEKKEKTA